MLEIKELYKAYDKLEVLKGVSFAVQRGETLAIMGPSGCGKSTILRCINRLTEADQGQIIYKGTNLLELSESEMLELRKEIAFVFQSFNLINRLTVWDNVLLALLKHKIPTKVKQQKVKESLAQVRLLERSEAYPSQLSGGEKQRVGLARALVIEPELILLDEPTAALDPILVKEVLDILEELTVTEDKTLIIVTHEVAFASRAADRILLMDQGKIVERGTPQAVFNNPSSKIGQKYQELKEYQ
ncbi:amino acid ABC transporter ATP-binding protein [Fuchsiella alkaliacetigena]|uniref:amino acid ABC transporter ATP-binding protein n=1 Tax=Fuchsiella alkaliacetigena TaxID=957042 RepID=UPI00200AA675|nr:amino acid ABC transporter ATP-binding protein [Fuchsiella alkaliacetigena]MCK8824267.1 amino acid ABC transporter ATP-binding protein [Fuchsiella alkaliacetigena]